MSKNLVKEIILTDAKLVYVTKNSYLNYTKIMLHKIKFIKYFINKRKFKFIYDVPAKTVCRSRVQYDKIEFSGYR